MQPFAYSNSPYPIRADLPEAYRHAWQKLSEPGTWLTGAQRVAVAQEVRNAATCEYCTRRKAALSPFAPLEGEHHTTTDLQPVHVDLVHRLTTDPSRLTQGYVDSLVESGDFTSGHYVETVSCVITTICIDSFNEALGFELEPLPQPQAGEPTRYTPDGLETGTSWVPMLNDLSDAESDLWPPNATANVIRALSSVPDAVRLLKVLSAAQYVPNDKVPDANFSEGRALSRAQIEFIAARVSAINDCFY